MDGVVHTHTEDELREIMRLMPPPQPGEDCDRCQRPVPKLRSDTVTGAKRSVVSIHEPAGEEGTLDQLMIAVVDKYKEAWPRDFASMRDGLGLETVGGRSWKYYVMHFSLYAVLTVPGLEPTE